VTAFADLTEPGLQADQRLLDRAWLRIGAGLVVAGQAMAFSLAVNLTPPEGTAYWVLHGGLMISAVGVLVLLGGDLVGAALGALQQRRINIDLLFLVTLAGAFAGSVVATFTHTGSVYYEVVAILVVVHTAGKMLGARSRVAALRAVDQTRERFDFCDVRQADGSRVRRTVREIAADDVVLVAPGAPVCVDGEIMAGRGFVEESSMTGEWRPVSRGPGDRVLAGTFSVDGSFEVRAAGGPRRLDAVLAAVAGARLTPSRLQRQADRLVAWFLPVVALVSFATFCFWIFRAPWNQALFNAMAVLLVACPCAAGLATPVAVWGGLARLASFGLVARTGDFLDALARCDVVCLDKTGTLSTAMPAVRAWRIEPAFHARAAWLKSAVAAAEDGLVHPIAAALLVECQPIVDKVSAAVGVVVWREHQPADGRRPGPHQETERAFCNLIGYKMPVLTERQIEPGLGVVARVEDEAGTLVEIRVGERMLGGGGVGVPAKARGCPETPLRFAVEGAAPSAPLGYSAATARRPPDPGGFRTVSSLPGRPDSGLVEAAGPPAAAAAGKEVFVFVDGVPAATVELAETWREGMEEALEELETLGVEAEVLTGDASAAVGRLGTACVRAGLTPAEKHERVRALVAAGRAVVFVGDGVNDAAAMSAAQASIAMRAGADLARAAAMAVFAGDDLRFLPQAIRLARAARRSISTNLRFAAGYNLAGMALAAAGILHPVVAALLMVGSSALVSANALRSVGAWNVRPSMPAPQPVWMGPTDSQGISRVAPSAE
jgi:cation transport ATPase